MKKLLILFCFIPFLSFGQEYEIKANVTVSISKECHELVMSTISNGDRDGFARLRGECFEVVGDKGYGLSGVRVMKIEGHLTYSKFYLKGQPTAIVYILNDQVKLIN